MTFHRLTAIQHQLRARAAGIEKEAGVVTGLAKGVGKAMFRGSQRLGGPVMGPLMFGAGVLGVAGAAKSALGKSREYNRGFDPRIQELKLQGHRF